MSKKLIVVEVVLSVDRNVGVTEAKAELRERVNNHNGWIGSSHDDSKWLRIKKVGKALAKETNQS